MPKPNLVIVESPAKAKTIMQFLGDDYEVRSSMGHIRGIPSKPGNVDIENNFTPKYEVDADKKKVVKELKDASKHATTVWLASDEDREGEAIAWHVSEVLGLDPKNTKRIAFHEITKPALELAIKNPRSIDVPLVEAQQARQTLDYLVGFELSPVLWKKVRGGLSAGRVQSVAARLVVEREREIEAHQAESTFKLTAIFDLSDGTELNAEAPTKFTQSKQAKAVLDNYSNSTFSVAEITKKPGTRSPSAPFTTSTLQQEASNRLGYSPRLTMQLAQRLYESGLITYMRTDSPSLSQQAVNDISAYIKKSLGDNYIQVRGFKAKTAGAQEAHEAIRPTSASRESAGADERQKKLYNLIWRRAVASQMTPAKLERTAINIVASASDVPLEAKGEVVIFDGFLKVYGRSRDDTILPQLNKGDQLNLANATALENLSRGPARYTEASLVRKLEAMGIGRPSTYASTISTIQSRGYVERGDVEGEPRQVIKYTLAKGQVTEQSEEISYGKGSGKLYPTDTGLVVTDFLVKYFAEVLDYDFTKLVEDELDDIAEGKKERVEVLKHFYEPFHKLIEASDSISRATAAQARLVGNDPKTNLPIYARFGRYGPMLQRGEQSDDPKPDFAPLPPGAKIESVTLNEALEMFKLPRTVGRTDDGQEIKASVGRFGPYIVVGKLFVSIKPLDPRTISLEQAKELYAQKLKTEAEKNIADLGGGIKVLKGRWGPYVTDGKNNAKVPKETDPATINLETAKALLAAPKPTRRGRKTKK